MTFRFRRWCHFHISFRFSMPFRYWDTFRLRWCFHAIFDRYHFISYSFSIFFCFCHLNYRLRHIFISRFLSPRILAWLFRHFSLISHFLSFWFLRAITSRCAAIFHIFSMFFDADYFRLHRLLYFRWYFVIFFAFHFRWYITFSPTLLALDILRHADWFSH